VVQNDFEGPREKGGQNTGRRQKPDRIEPVRRGTAPSANRERVATKPDARLKAISAEDQKQFTAMLAQQTNVGPRLFLFGAELNALDPLVRLALLVR
jgi:hypothetical protein